MLDPYDLRTSYVHVSDFSDTESNVSLRLIFTDERCTDGFLLRFLNAVEFVPCVVRVCREYQLYKGKLAYAYRVYADGEISAFLSVLSRIFENAPDAADLIEVPARGSRTAPSNEAHTVYTDEDESEMETQYEEYHAPIQGPVSKKQMRRIAVNTQMGSFVKTTRSFGIPRNVRLTPIVGANGRVLPPPIIGKTMVRGIREDEGGRLVITVATVHDNGRGHQKNVVSAGRSPYNPSERE